MHLPFKSVEYMLLKDIVPFYWGEHKQTYIDEGGNHEGNISLSIYQYAKKCTNNKNYLKEI